MKASVKTNLIETLSFTVDNNEEIAKLKEYDDAYFNAIDDGDVLISDTEYDRLKKELQNKYPDHPYFKHVGASVRGEKEKLPHPMGSLNQIHEGDYQKWVKKYSIESKNMNISDKLDGVSCLLQYKDYRLYKAFSRGDGTFGHDITRHIIHLNGVPKTLKVKDLDVRGEVIMKDQTFLKNHSIEYRNPRNMVAGCMNRKTTEIPILKDIDFVAYQVVEADGKGLDRKEQEYDVLSDNGFLIVENRAYNSSALNDELMTQIFLDAKDKSEYALDGIVISVDDYSAVQHLSHSSSLNPEHTVKYKVLEENSVVETKVVNIEWNISKSGFFKPIVEIEPVDLFVTTVTYCTGKNAKYIYENKIGIGAVVKITKAGSVIPEIVDVVTPKSDDVENMPSEDWLWNETGVEALVADLNHPDVIFKSVLSFFETLDVELLKEASLRKVFEHFELQDKNYENILSIILDLSLYEWKMVVGKNGEKIYHSLRRRLENLTPEKLLGALNYLGFGFGERRAKQLISNLENFDNIWTLTESDISSMNGFDVKTSTRIVNGLPFVKKFVEDNNISFVQAETSSELKGVTVVMTGFRDSTLSEQIESMGGKVTSGVSKKTTYLLTYDVNSTSGKAKKARDYGVEVITPEKFKDLFNL